MTEFKRKKGESFESFLRRFNKGLRNSKTLNIARAKRSLSPPKSRREQKQYALKSLELRKQKNYLRKIGKLPEEETTFRR
jgi:ribosomal protein S21